MGDIRGLFLATPEQLADAVGKEVDLGEVLGKHSEIRFELTDEYYSLVTDDQEFIKKAVELGVVPHGHDPLSHIIMYCADELCGEKYDYDNGKGKCYCQEK